MGYCTYFTDVTGMTEDQLDKLSEITGWIVSFDDSMQWYEFKEDMAKLSTFFPDTLFELHGDGEESDDFWKGYWQNGKCQISQATIIYEPYEKSRMSQLVEPIPIPPPIEEGQFTVKGDSLEWDF